jgi:hypothetical protein
MLAYVSWHRPAPGVERSAYERALEHFHSSLGHRPPSGTRGSVSYRASELPWLDPNGQGGYEDWYLLDGWSAVGVLEEAAVSRGHITAHDSIAKLAGPATSAIYRLIDGHADLGATRVAVWVTRDAGHQSPEIAELMGDGMDPRAAGLWRRCIGLGPAPEYCLLAPSVPAGVAQGRLPVRWTARTYDREVLWNG